MYYQIVSSDGGYRLMHYDVVDHAFIINDLVAMLSYFDTESDAQSALDALCAAGYADTPYIPFLWVGDSYFVDYPFYEAVNGNLRPYAEALYRDELDSGEMTLDDAVSAIEQDDELMNKFLEAKSDPDYNLRIALGWYDWD